MPDPNAYLLARISTITGQIASISIYSEPSPTVAGLREYTWAILASAYAPRTAEPQTPYSAARAQLLEMLESPEWRWMRRFWKR